MLVYLMGPINGCTDDEASTWRDQVKAELGEEHTLDPMRRDYRGVEDESVDAIVDGDLEDIGACTSALANCWQVSWGTAMEIFYAHSIGRPVIAVLPEGTRISPWLRYHTRAIVHTLPAALRMLRSLERRT